MLQDPINSLFICNDLFELADRLEALLPIIDSARDKNKTLREIHGNLNIYQMGCSQPFYIVEGREACISYLRTYWIFQRTYKDNKKCLEEIVAIIREVMLPPQKPRISLEMIDSLMELVNQKFNFQQRILINKSLKILLIDHSHIRLGAYYVATLFEVSPESTVLSDKIVIPHLRHEIDFPQEFIFLHELGHALHTRVTGELMTPPDSFQEVLEQVFPKAIHESDTIKSELFADSFAIATLNASDYSRYDPYSVLREEDRLFSTDYMLNLIRTTFENPHSLEQTK